MKLVFVPAAGGGLKGDGDISGATGFSGGVPSIRIFQGQTATAIRHEGFGERLGFAFVGVEFFVGGAQGLRAREIIAPSGLFGGR